MTVFARSGYALAEIPKGVWALGFVSMLMDISSEMIHALLPLYLVTVLGTSMITVGVIEGIAEATASITKIFSGALSDMIGKRKVLVAIGYRLAAFTKPVFPLASTVGWFVAARFVDRVGKGIRGAPRDALVADISPRHLRGASFGLRQALDTIGAFLGPVVVIVLMWWTADHFQTVFWIAVIPAFLALALLLYAVREPERHEGLRKVRNPFSLREVKTLGPNYWTVVGIGVVFTLARFSEAFLVLRAQNVGVPVMWAPAVMVVMNVAYSLAAYPAGVLSDRTSRLMPLMCGMVLLIAADIILAFVPTRSGLAVGVVFWGLHMAFTQGVFAALVADVSPPELRGTAFGFIKLLTGVAMLTASIVAGVLWDMIGPGGTFMLGAAFTTLALIGAFVNGGRIAEGAVR